MKACRVSQSASRSNIVKPNQHKISLPIRKKVQRDEKPETFQSITARRLKCRKLFVTYDLLKVIHGRKICYIMLSVDVGTYAQRWGPVLIHFTSLFVLKSSTNQNNRKLSISSKRFFISNRKVDTPLKPLSFYLTIPHFRVWRPRSVAPMNAVYSEES